MTGSGTSAVVGLSIGRSHIVEGYLPNPARSGSRALCDLDEARLNAVGDEFGIERPHHVLRRPARRSATIDIIDICTPPCCTVPMVEAALAAGKHVSARSR